MTQPIYFNGGDATIAVNSTTLACTNWNLQEHGNQFSTTVTGNGGFDSVQGSTKYLEGSVDYLVPITSTTFPLQVNSNFTSASFTMNPPTGTTGGSSIAITMSGGIVTGSRINGPTNGGVSVTYTIRSNGSYTLPVAGASSQSSMTLAEAQKKAEEVKKFAETSSSSAGSK